MTKYIKTTDRSGLIPQSGYHSVNDDFVLPEPSKDTQFEFVSEKEARIARPALFGARPSRERAM